jgi:hypothetical protein
MNTCKLHRLLAAGAFAFPLLVLGQTPSSSYPQQVNSSPQPGVVGSGTPQAPTPVTVKRVDQGQLSRTFTARDLIGKNVVNHDGERLGTINDVALGRAWFERFGPPQGDADLPITDDARNDLLVFVSTGGVLGLGGRLGVGADWVSVSADTLLYDRQQDRFILNVPQAQFTAIAQGRATNAVYATGGGPAAPGSTATSGSATGTIGGDHGSGGLGTSPADTIGRDHSSSDLRRIENALADHRELRGRARIQVSHTGSAIQLSGVVDDPLLIRRAGDIARQQTDLEVRNLLEVSRGSVAE